MQTWEKANENEKKKSKLKKTSKTEKEWKYWRYEIRTNKKGENNSGYAWFEACFLIKIFKKKRCAYLDQASIAEKKKYDQNIFLVERQSRSGRNPKLTELAEGFILGLIIANNTLKWWGIK